MADTLREFLVSLGYQVGDDRAWTRALANVDKSVASFAASIGSLEAAARKMFVSVTEALDRATWASTRAGSSIANLQALAYAMKQTGRASDPVSAFASELRKFPGVESVVQRLGVQTRVNGKLRDLTEVLLDAVEATLGQPYVEGANNARLIGISEADYEHLRRNLPRLRAEMEERKRIAREMGHDPDKGGLASTIAMQNYRSAMMQIEVAISAVAVAIVPTVTPLLEGLDRWIAANQDGIREFVRVVVEVAADLVAAVGRLVEALAPSAETIAGLVSAATGKNGLVVAIEALSVVFLAGIVLEILLAIGRVRVAILALVATVATGRYVAPQIFGGGVREAREGPDERPKPGMFERAGRWVREKTGWGGRAGGGEAVGRPAGGSPGEVVDRGGGDPGTAPIPATATTYSPQQGGDRMEGGYAAAVKGPDGTAVVRTLEDYRLGRSKYVTIAASRSFFHRKYTIPSVTYQVGGKTYTIRNVPVYVNDTGSAFAGAPEGRIDVPIDRDLGGKDTNQGLRGIQLKPGWAPPTDPKATMDQLDRVQSRSLEERTERSRLRTSTPWGDPSTKTQGRPLVEQQSDADTVNTNRTTRITVHGDTNPTRTADDVARAQSKVNADMITTTDEALP